MSTTLAKLKRAYGASSATLSAALVAGQWGQDQATGRILAMRRDGVTVDVFQPSSELATTFGGGTSGYHQKANGSGGLSDSLIYESGAFVSMSNDNNGPTLFTVQNPNAGTGAYAGILLTRDASVSAGLYHASSGYTTEALATSRLNLYGAGINLRASGSTDAVRFLFGSSMVSGNLYATINKKGLKLESMTLTTDADGTVAGNDISLTLTKNDSNTRHFYSDKLIATLNPGGSNANTTLDLLFRDTVNTATTGMTVNLAVLKYGGSARWKVDSFGRVTNGNSSIEGTGSDSPTMTNAPTLSTANPWTWIDMYSSDGTLCMYPVWKKGT